MRTVRKKIGESARISIGRGEWRREDTSGGNFWRILPVGTCNILSLLDDCKGC